MNDKTLLWQRALLAQNATIKDAVSNLNEVAIRIALVLDDDGRLIGTLSDGDIRRALLRGLNLTSPITNVFYRNALVVPPELRLEQVLQLMESHKIQQIPIVDAEQRVIGLHLWEEIVSRPARTNLLVIMAGGKGTRLRPHTEHCPKPMLLVAGKPMLEHIIERAKLEGFRHFVIAIHYLGHIIEEYFGRGARLGVQIDYLREDSPLGTAGALSLLNPKPNLPFVVTNGDVITDIRYGELLGFHEKNNASATMAVKAYEWQNPFGVVTIQGLDIVKIEEKPIFYNYINAGVYALNQSVLNTLASGEYCDMTTLFQRLGSKSERIMAYPLHELWLDVGRLEDLNRANIAN